MSFKRKLDMGASRVPLAGDHVLISPSRYLGPETWFIAAVLWIDEKSVLIESLSEDFRNIFEVENIRAIGQLEQLDHFLAECCEATQKQRQRIAAHEQAIRTERELLTKKIEQIIGSVPRFIPPASSKEETAR
jgi:hypothetical protein